MLPTVEDILNATRTDTYREQYIPTRYPYTYAADFVRQHPEIVPSQYLRGNEDMMSRADASGVIHRWAEGEQYDGADQVGGPGRLLAEVLADSYLRVHGIEKP